jgi:hypothetical protein
MNRGATITTISFHEHSTTCILSYTLVSIETDAKRDGIKHSFGGRLKARVLRQNSLHRCMRAT